MKYYLLYLNNNDCVNKARIKDVRLLVNFNDEKIYENIEVLGYEKGTFISSSHMYDVITNKEIFSSENAQGISYKSKIPVDDETLNRILAKYNSLTNEEITRYKKGIDEIEKNSLIKYNELVSN